MKLFLDSADLAQIKQAYTLGIVDGVTTNPSLIKKATEKYATTDMHSYISQIFEVVGNNPVSLEIKGGSFVEMYTQARTLYDTFKTAHNSVIIKVPISASLDSTDETFSQLDALRVISKLSSEGIPTNVTLVFSPEQALLAAKAGATYVSPFVGREDDYIRSKKTDKFNKEDYFVNEPFSIAGDNVTDNGIHSGLELIKDIVQIYQNFGFSTQVLAASLRNSRQVRDAAIVGCDVATIPLSLFIQMVTHPKTIEGMQNFTSDFVSEYEVLFDEK